MAGHSRWAKVKHFNGGIDAKRALAFAKLSKEIMVAARIGGVSRLFNRTGQIIVSRDAAHEDALMELALEDVKELYHNAEFAA
jgi:transcriptional/translational regulatory protein YebC/TACO1